VGVITTVLKKSKLRNGAAQDVVGLNQNTELVIQQFAQTAG